MLFRRAMIFTALCALSMSVVACGASRQSGICGSLTPPATAKGDADGLITQGDAAWEQRADESQLRVAIARWQKALANHPSRPAQRVKRPAAHRPVAARHSGYAEARQPG